MFLTAHILGLTTRDDFRMTIVLLEHVSAVSQFSSQTYWGFLLLKHTSVYSIAFWLSQGSYVVLGFSIAWCIVFSRFESGSSLTICENSGCAAISTTGKLGFVDIIALDIIWASSLQCIIILQVHTRTHTNPSCQLDIDRLIKINAGYSCSTV